MVKNKLLIIIVMMSIMIVGVQAATLTCQQITDTSLSIPQFSSSVIEIRCTASSGSVSNILITPNADPSTGVTISNTQTISSTISDQSSSTAKWSVTGDTPNTYTLSYTVSSSGTNSWTGASTTEVTVPSEAQLSVEYVLPPSIFTPTVNELDFKINNIGGTTANSVNMKLYKAGTLVSSADYPTTIAASASASYTWTNETGFNESGTYTTEVYIGDVFHDNTSITVSTGTVNQTQYAGWNLVSLTKIPTNKSVVSLFSSIVDKLTIAWHYNVSDPGDYWKKYDPLLNPEASDLQYLDETQGFWTRTTQTVNLEVEGSDLAGGTIPLYSGWNMIGYPATENKLVNDSVVTIVSDLNIIWMYNASDTGDYWKKYDPLANPEANDLEYLSQGEGYWFRMDGDTTFNLTW